MRPAHRLTPRGPTGGSHRSQNVLLQIQGASSFHIRPDYTSIPAAALEIRPRPAFECSRTPREQPLTYFSSQQYERPTSRRFYTPSALQPVLSGTKVKASSPTVLLSTLRAKAKARENSAPKEKGSEKGSDQGSEKESAKGFKGPARAKAKKT